MSCNCIQDIEYTKDPPFVSAKSLRDFIYDICSDCNEAIAVATEPTYPDCCDDHIVIRNSVEVLRVYDAGEQKYIGGGATYRDYVYSKNTATAITANTPLTIPFTSTGSLSLIASNMNDISAASDGFTIINNNGFYTIEVIVDTNNTTTTKGMNLHLHINGTDVTYQTMINGTSNPSENTERRAINISYRGYLNIGDIITIRLVSGLTFSSTNLNAYVRFTRLSVTR